MSFRQQVTLDNDAYLSRYGKIQMSLSAGDIIMNVAIKEELSKTYQWLDEHDNCR